MPKPRSRPRSRTDDDPEAAERRAAQAELRRARQRLTTLGNVLLGGGVALALGAVLLGFWYWRFSVQGFGGTPITYVLGTLAAGSAIQAAVFFLGQALAKGRPVPAAIIPACTATFCAAMLGLVLWQSGLELGVWHAALGVQVLLALLLWGLLASALRLEDLRQEHPELFTRSGRGEGPLLTRGPGLAAAFFGLAGLVIVVLMVIEESPESAARRFESAWNSGDPAALDDLVVSGDGGRLLTRARRQAGSDDLPTIEFQEFLDTDLGRVQAQFHSPSMILRVQWRMPQPGGDWAVTQVKFR